MRKKLTQWPLLENRLGCDFTILKFATRPGVSPHYLHFLSFSSQGVYQRSYFCTFRLVWAGAWQPPFV